MPTGRVKWYDTEKGFGFISRDDGTGDVFVHKAALPEGVEALTPGQRLDFGVMDTRRGVQAMTVKILEAPPSVAAAQRRSPEELNSLIEDMIKVLEMKVLPSLRRGRHPDRKATAKIAEVVHAVARELEV
ncbi:cold-shock protein CspA [Actinorhabdospora filicis]|uniref:Cold-shock protein CspA n=1 Tax=Actinorhabdospora filicis TaxID=1785913 RepID=A0A9W6WCJ0_9ACTN|nr:cold-shock protein CspA [Actinorhabdospora filicis]